jgi:glycosyltransferase involved in cell wall biosynthesis
MKVLIIVNNDIDTDPRVLNQWEAIKHYGEIHFMANAVKNTTHSEFFNFAFLTRRYTFHYHYPIFTRKVVTLYLLIIKAFLSFLARLRYKNPHQRRYWQHVRTRALHKIKNSFTYDYIIANDIDTLPIAAFLKKENTKLIFDAHEYFLEENDDPVWIQNEYPYRKHLIDTHLQEIDVFMTIGDNIAERFEKEFKLNAKPIIIYNAKPYFANQPTPVNPEKIRMVHHGVALPNRNLETLVAVTQILPVHFELHLYLKKIDAIYYEQFCKNYGGIQRVFIHEAIPFNAIISTIKSYDIGIFLMKNQNYNSYNCLPNKFFEFIQANLMLVMTDMAEIKKLIQKYQNGIIVQGSTEEIANQIKNLTTQQIQTYKQNSAVAAKQLSAEQEWQKIRNLMGIG